MEFTSKPLRMPIVARAIDLCPSPGSPLTSGCQSSTCWVWLEQHDSAYVLATKCNDTLSPATHRRGEPPRRRAHRRPSRPPGLAPPSIVAGLMDLATTTGRSRSGSAGPPDRHWVSGPTQDHTDPGHLPEIAYTSCFGTAPIHPARPAWNRRNRWRIEDNASTGPNEAGL